MKFDAIDLIVQDVPAAAQFFRDIVGLILIANEEQFAEIKTDTMTIMLSPTAMIPINNAAGIILHFQVDDVRATVERAHRQGSEILMPPTQTEWGTESAMIAGQEGIVIDFCRLL
jgi:uncharacterized glyoxalase superfamily protein PhnB